VLIDRYAATSWKVDVLEKIAGKYASTSLGFISQIASVLETVRRYSRKLGLDYCTNGQKEGSFGRSFPCPVLQLTLVRGFNSLAPWRCSKIPSVRNTPSTGWRIE